MKQMKKHVSLLLLLALALALLAGCSSSQPKESETGEAAKKVTVTVVHKDGSEKAFELETAEEMLGPALVAGNVVEDNQSTYGLYILTADGETADEANEEWWCLTKAGEEVSTGADSTPIQDGDVFELTLTVGWS